MENVKNEILSFLTSIFEGNNHIAKSEYLNLKNQKIYEIWVEEMLEKTSTMENTLSILKNKIERLLSLMNCNLSNEEMRYNIPYKGFDILISGDVFPHKENRMELTVKIINPNPLSKEEAKELDKNFWNNLF